MFNLIKSDLYRLFHTKAVKIGLIVAAAIALGGMLLNLGLIALITAVTENPAEIVSMGEVIPALAWSVDGTDYANIVFTNVGSLSLLVACVISASFVSSEQTCGYVKNIAGQLPRRGYTVISKFVATALINLLILAVYTVISCVFAPMLFGKYITSYTIAPLIGAIAVRFLLYLAIDAVIVLLCTLTKSPSLAMVIGAIFGLSVTTVAYVAVSMVVSFVFKGSNFFLADYMPDGINNALSIFNVGSLWVKALIVSLIFIIASLAGAIAIVEKRDVK